jgi:hypothetical protein
MADTSQLTDFEFYGFESLEPPDIAARPVQWNGSSSNISSIGTDRKRPRNGISRESCEWCGQPLGPRSHSGRTRLYCGQSCRQRAYQSRKRSRQLSLREGELVVSSVLVTRLNKRLRALDLALSEVEKAHLEDSDELISHLCQAARVLGRQVIGPPAR